MMIQANILDPIHADLDPRVWNNHGHPEPVLKPQHRHWIQSTVRRTLDQAGYSHIDEWLTLILTGSLTTYQYSDESDCDISLFVDNEKFPEWSRAEMIGVMVDHVDGTTLPGTPHPMQCFVVGAGISVHDLYKPGLRSGYSLNADQWIVPPERNRVHNVQAEYNGYYVYALEMADKMERLLKYEPDKATKFWHQIHARRQRDQRAGKGDYSESNIVYKFLANRGLFPQISDVSGEYIAHEAAKPPRGAKFVYHPHTNRIVVGPMGALEGENPSHLQLYQQLDVPYKAGNAGFGMVGENGWASLLSRPKLVGPNRKGNPAELQYQTEEAVRRAIPGARFTNPRELLNPQWELQADPEVIYAGEPPQIVDTNEEAPEEWTF